MKTSDGKSSDSIKSSGSTKSISSKKLKISDDPTTSPEVGGDTPAVVKPASPSKPVKPSDPKPIKSTDPNFEKLKASDTPQPQKDEFPTLATIYPLSLPFKKKISSDKQYASFVQYLRANHHINHLKLHLSFNKFLSNIHIKDAQEKLDEALKIAEGFLGYNDNILQIKTLVPTHTRVLLLLKKFLDPSSEDPIEKKRETAGIIYFTFNKQVVQELVVIWKRYHSKKC